MESLAKQKRDITMITYHKGKKIGCWFLQDDRYDPWEQPLKNEYNTSTCQFFKAVEPLLSWSWSDNMDHQSSESSVTLYSII